MARTASATETHGKGFARLMVWRFSNFAHFSLLRWRGVHRAGRAFQPAHAQPTGTGAALSLPVRWRFLLLSRFAPLAGLATFRQTFVRRCQGGLAETQVDNPRR